MFSHKLTRDWREPLISLKRPIEVASSAPIVSVIKLTTAVAAAMTASAPICAVAGGGPTSPKASAIAKKMAMLDLPLPVIDEKKRRLRNCISDHPATVAAATAFTAPDNSSGSSATSASPIGNFAA